MAAKRIRVKWKSQWNIIFWMIQNPLSPNFQSNSMISDGSFRVDGEATGTPDAKRVERDKVHRGGSGYHFKPRTTRPRVGRGTSQYVSVTPTATHHHGRQAAAEMVLTAAGAMYSASVMNQLWRAIVNKQTTIATAIMDHGGVMIVGRVLMSDMPNPDTGMRQAFFKDIYMSGAAESWDAYESAEDKPKKDQAFVGPPAPKPKVTMQAPPAPVMRAALFPGPKNMIHEEPGQTLEHFFVWAERAEQA